MGRCYTWNSLKILIFSKKKKVSAMFYSHVAYNAQCSESLHDNVQNAFASKFACGLHIPARPFLDHLFQEADLYRVVVRAQGFTRTCAWSPPWAWNDIIFMKFSMVGGGRERVYPPIREKNVFYVKKWQKNTHLDWSQVKSLNIFKISWIACTWLSTRPRPVSSQR